MKYPEQVILLKLGGSVITNATHEINTATIRKIAQEISKHSMPFVIIHGGGSYTKSVVKKYNLESDFIPAHSTEVVDEFRRVIRQLSMGLQGIFREENLRCTLVDPGKIFKIRQGKIVRGNINALSGYLMEKVTPILHGDIFSDVNKGFYACSSDEIMAHLAINMRAKYAFFLTNVDGVYKVFPPEPGTQHEVSVNLEFLDKNRSEYHVGYADMCTKIEQALYCANNGTECWIINGHHPERLSAIVEGRPGHGTKLLGGVM